MRTARGAIALAAAAGSQAALTAYLPDAARFFDLYLIVAVYYALTTTQVRSMLIGTLCGLAQDGLVAAPPLGQNAFAKTLIGYLVGGFGRRFEMNQPVPQLLALASATLLHAVVLSALRLVLGLPMGFPPGRDLVGRVLGNGLLGVAIYAVVRRRKERRR